MVLNRSEEEGYHYVVQPLGKLIELPVWTSEISPPSSRLGGWGGHSDGAAIRTTLFLIFNMLALHHLHDLAFLNCRFEHLFNRLPIDDRRNDVVMEEEGVKEEVEQVWSRCSRLTTEQRPSEQLELYCNTIDLMCVSEFNNKWS